MFAIVDLEASRKRDVLVVPAAAVQTLEGKPSSSWRLLLTEGAAFQRRARRTRRARWRRGRGDEGLKPGERVVVANAYLLKSEFERAKIGGGHAH